MYIFIYVQMLVRCNGKNDLNATVVQYLNNIIISVLHHRKCTTIIIHTHCMW